jgi:two-component system, NtrC family, response regulator AtoC
MLPARTMENQKSLHILVVDDDSEFQRSMRECLEEGGEGVSCASSVPEALELLKANPFDVVIAGFNPSGIDGHELIVDAVAVYPEIVLIALTSTGTVQGAVRAMKRGASDYLCKPIPPAEVRAAMKQALQIRRFREEKARTKSSGPRPGIQNIVGKSKAMQDVSKFAETIAASNSSVLITGETGTGKELVARAIHSLNERRDQKMVCINCAAIPENLLESELFGHVKGAFTGAHQTRIGRFEQAHKGTIFFDEIGNMSISLQAKMLRVLQEREFERVGGFEKIKVDVRIIAATSASLKDMIQRNEFRSDLYYRLNVIPIHMPSLRERREDIPLLVLHFIDKYCLAGGLEKKTITQEAMKVLMNHSWPGNVRELENAVEHAIAVSGTRSVISAADLPEEVQNTSHNLFVSEIYIPDEGVNFNTEISALERQLILQSLKKTGGNKREAAQLLQLKRTTLIEKLRRLNVQSATA